MTPLQLFLYGLAIAVGGLGLSVLAANARSAAHRCFALTALIIAGWTLGVGGRLGGAGIETWLRLSFACASLIPPAVLAFASVYPLDGRRPARLVLRLSIVLGCLFAILSLTTRLVFFDPVMTPTGLSRRAGPLYPVFAAYFLVTWVHFLGVLLGNTVSARGRARARLQYVSAAAIITSAGGISTNLLLPLLTGRSSYTWLGPCFGVVFLLLIGHAIVRHRLLDVKFVVHRGLPLALAAAASLLPLALPLVWFWPQLSSSLPSTEWPLLVVALLGGGLLVPLTRRGALKLLDRYLYRAKPDYEPTVQEISKALTQVLDRGALLNLLVTRLTKIVQPEGLAIYLVEDAVGTLAIREVAASETFPVPDLMPRSVLQALGANRDVIEAGERHHQHLLGELGWALVLPLIADGVVIGAIVVGPKLSGDLYYPQDMALLRTLANQAAVAVKNAQLYAEVVIANEAITLFNRAAELLTGLRADRVRLHSVNVLPACLAEPLTRAVADGRGITCPEITLTDGVALRSIISTVSPLRDKTGAVLGGVSVFSDLTPLQELEHERRRAEKLNYFESLASGLAHEIKNPLVAIKTFVQLIPLRLSDTRWLGDFSRLVEREIDRIERLLNRLATLGRAGMRPHRRLDLRVPIRDALELVQPALATKRLTVTVRLGEREEPVLGDQDELTQLVHNLLINALEHTPIGGTVGVELGASDHLVTLTVADSGPGIRSEHLERVFDPLFTTRRDGTGLGLAICMGIAAAHRARIRVANHPEHGAVFTVEFPVAVVEPAAEVPA
jgi:signal transduction histidine kinase